MDGDILPDAKIIAIAHEGAWLLGVLSSRPHTIWATRTGAFLGVGNDSNYNHSECFGTFPFPATSDAVKTRIGRVAESLDAHRKKQQAVHPDLTITGMYNVLEKLRSGATLTPKEKKTHDDGLVSVLKQLHDDLDAAVFDAYGWPSDLTDEQILERLVKLNAERAAEEAKGLVRWLRPEFQAAGAKAKKPTQVALIGTSAPDKAAATGKAAKQPWPKALPEQIAAIRTLLGAGDALSVKATAAAFNRADRGDVEASLDALVALGLAVAFGKGDERRWRAAGRVAA